MVDRRLVEQFAKAGLHLEMQSKPIRNGRGMDLIFQIDIQRRFKGNERGEYFRIYPGKDTVIQVRDTDREINQLVLLVAEPVREFEEEIRRHRSESDARWHEQVAKVKIAKSTRIISVTEKSIRLARKTSEEKRYFLMGVDERQLFIAQLNDACTSVKQACDSLGRTVQLVEGTRRNTRQGEWFFLETKETVRDAIDAGIKDGSVIVRKKTAISEAMKHRRGGKPHMADEIAIRKSSSKLEHGYAVRTYDYFVRGKITHPDHKTVSFKQWRQVIANNEAGVVSSERGARIRSTGVFWFD